MLKDFYVFLLILTILKFYICTLIYNYEIAINTSLLANTN